MKGIYVSGDLAGLLRTYLDHENLPAESIRKQLASIASHSQMSMNLWWDLLEQIQELQKIPALGLRIGQHVQAHHSGVLGYLIMHCKTLGEALLRFQRYQQLLHNYSGLELFAGEGSLTLSWDTEQGLSTQLSDEVFMSGLITFVRNITGRPDLCPQQITFNHEVEYEPACYEAIMGCPVIFGQERVSITLSTKLLSLGLNTHDPHLLNLLEKQAQALLVSNQDQDEFVRIVQQEMMELMVQGHISLKDVAKKMNLSTRTLHRRLEDRNLNFRELLQQVRRQLADLYLKDLSLTLNEIAFLLGYSEQSAFTRAFKNWHQTTPRKRRAELTGD